MREDPAGFYRKFFDETFFWNEREISVFLVTEGTQLDLNLPFERTRMFLLNLSYQLDMESDHGSAAFNEEAVKMKVLPYVIAHSELFDPVALLRLRARYDESFIPQDLHGYQMAKILCNARKYEQAAPLYHELVQSRAFTVDSLQFFTQNEAFMQTYSKFQCQK